MKGCYVHFMDKSTEAFVRSRMEEFNVPEVEIAHVAELVRYHAATDDIFTSDNQINPAAHEDIKRRFLNTIYSDLMLLTFADAMSENTKNTNPAEFQLKMTFYNDLVYQKNMGENFEMPTVDSIMAELNRQFHDRGIEAVRDRAKRLAIQMLGEIKTF